MLRSVLRRDICLTLKRSLLLRCLSGRRPGQKPISQKDLQDELQRSVRRRHVVDASFDEINTQYISHPLSRSPSIPLGYPDVKVEELLNQFFVEKSVWDSSEVESIFAREMTSIVTPHRAYHDKFLSTEELELVNQKLVERAQSLLTPCTPLLAQRQPVHSETSIDQGLALLYNSDLTFVDVSDDIEDVSRYMAVREQDGTLRHCSEEERDQVHNSFLPFKGQLVPTAAVMKYDEVFDERAADGDVVVMLELLESSYQSDHPMFVQRQTQLMEIILANKDHLSNVLLTRFLPHLMQRWAQDIKHTEGLDNLITVLQKYQPRSQASIEVLEQLKLYCIENGATAHAQSNYSTDLYGYCNVWAPRPWLSVAKGTLKRLGKDTGTSISIKKDFVNDGPVPITIKGIPEKCSEAREMIEQYIAGSCIALVPDSITGTAKPLRSIFKMIAKDTDTSIILKGGDKEGPLSTHIIGLAENCRKTKAMIDQLVVEEVWIPESMSDDFKKSVTSFHWRTRTVHQMDPDLVKDGLQPVTIIGQPDLCAEAAQAIKDMVTKSAAMSENDDNSDDDDN